MQRNVVTQTAVLLLLTAAAIAAGPATSPAPTVLALVLDTSGSVGAAELERTRKLTLDILQNLPAGSEVAVLTFDDQSRVVQPRTSVAEEVRKALTGIQIAGRYTALHDALYDASRYLREAPPGRKAIVLVTDGKDENSSLNLEDGLRLAEENGIPVFAVGVGQRVEERVLRRIAKITGGDYVSAAEASGSGIATKILEKPAPARPTSAVAQTQTTVPPPAPSARPSIAATASTPATVAVSRRPWGLLGRALIGVLVLSAAVLALRAIRRSRPASRCPSCGRALATPLSECPFCASATLDSRAPREIQPDDGSQPETVVTRIDADDELLEKTVTLQENPVLIITAGPGSGHVFTLSLESMMSIGRAKANDIVLEDVAVSSQHCRIRPDDGQFIVHDLRSTNGTFVNDHRVTRSHLRSGDVLKIGETTMQFRMDQKRP
jgi:uncharacterized protein YegL